MLAKHVMTRPVHNVAADASVYDASQVLLNAGISAAPVVDADGTMLGIVSEADLMHRPEIGTVPGKSWLQRLMVRDAVRARNYIRAHSHRVSDVMTRNVITAGERASLADIAMLMERHGIKRVPIVRDGRVVGIVSRANLLQGLLARQPAAAEDEDPVDDDRLRARVMAELAKHSWAASSPPTSIVAGDGVVHLWGCVGSAAIKDACGVAAESVRGVRRVENHMSVQPLELD